MTSAPKRDRASRRLRRLWRVVGFIARALWNIGLAELISSYNGGLIPDDALVWREGMEEWQKIRDVPEVQELVQFIRSTRRGIMPCHGARSVSRVDSIGAQDTEPSGELWNPGEPRLARVGYAVDQEESFWRCPWIGEIIQFIM